MRAQLDPGAKFFTEALIRHAKNLHILDLGVPIEEFFHFARVDIFPTANHQILDSTHDVAEAFRINRRQITSMHPARGVNGLCGAFRVFPIAQHHRIAARAKLTRHAARHDAALAVYDLHFQMRLHAANGGNATFQRVIHTGLEADGAGFRHAIGDGNFTQIHGFHHTAHDLNRAGRAGHNACAQR